ncbi:MAG: hypothetical protein GTO63_23990 [Anaerolineae bacterium]|nr:hypothetical protein [Anaerolineae bacterium]NIN97783.1 hypothetical protein [Anaerolineae bacterium]NIQ80779.1 hypothetical protein [Anaerolineae bacterium]
MRRFELSIEEGNYPIHSLSLLVGEDLVTCIWGGTQPHIGAVGIALPRPSIADPNIVSSTSSVFTVLGHKEDELVKMVSERLSARLQKNVVVAAGVHWDHLEEDAIIEIMDNCRVLAEKVADVIEREE